ncbi:DUF5808 domain-containing protein [Puerhibacterium sp. TATVAM-FAB25]|uniref:DUF5808 domain-containing protein n=1 Tax=Puerhibacterium sp. TATVAM-FAB25 TaxID=3093699 RepID=UPI0039784DDB
MRPASIAINLARAGASRTTTTEAKGMKTKGMKTKGTKTKGTKVGGAHGKGARRGRLKGVYTAAMASVAVAAVVKELRLPADQRTWHGKVAGLVPYDFRFPTMARLKERMWAPESSQLVNPRAFGVGWTLNVGRVVAVVRERVGR